MIASNLHTHTIWCDGKNTAREMADASVRLGVTDLGFSSHYPTPFDPTCPGIQNEAAYRAEIKALADEYAGTLGILCGVEEDFRACVNRQDYDYVITSNHYLPPHDGRIMAVDNSLELLLAEVNTHYDGNEITMLRDYYTDVVRSVEVRRPDVVGHFDLVKKFNRDDRVFNENSAEYRQMALSALDAVLDVLLKYGGMLEVNTGAWARGLRDEPYPAPFLLRHAAQRKAPVILSSDSHSVTTLNAKFDEAIALLCAAGFSRVMTLKAGARVPIRIG
jgi:histidinol-phosphatase (PHP family)